MKKKYHREITREALGSYVDPSALETIIAANLGQDALRYQIGHDHFHYDSSAFQPADAYVEALRQAVQSSLEQNDTLAARLSLGRLTHTVQDFYAHSNYVSLWRERHPDAPADQIEPELPELRQDARLRSGRLYYPLEALSFVPLLKPFILPFLPRDSHAWMNIDAPDRPGFAAAFAAAVKRTRIEYMRIAAKLTPRQAAALNGHDLVL